MKRKRSCCNADGYNSCTCPIRTGKEIDGGGGGGVLEGGDDGGFTLFGVRLTDGSYIKKSFSMGNLSQNHSSSLVAAAPDSAEGYHSDHPGGGSASCALPRSQKRKVVPWTEEEHRQFLLGLQRFGKGEWRHISRKFVPSRTPTQVASHAQKFYSRHCNSATRGKRRSSLFDMVLDTATHSSSIPVQFSISLPAAGTDNAQLTLLSSHEAETDHSVPSLNLSLKSASSPPPFHLWPPNSAPPENDRAATSEHHIFKTIPVVSKEPVNVEGLMSMSQLTLGVAGSGHNKPLPLS